MESSEGKSLPGSSAFQRRPTICCMDPSLQLRLTGCPTFCRTVGGFPWELPLKELVRFESIEPSSTVSRIAPPNVDPLPPVGIWRVPRLNPHWVEQLQILEIDAVMFVENPSDPAIRTSLEAYVEYFNQGFEPPPANVVYNQPSGRLVTLNRRRVYAAKLAGRTHFAAWVGGDEYDDVVRRAADAGVV